MMAGTPAILDFGDCVLDASAYVSAVARRVLRRQRRDQGLPAHVDGPVLDQIARMVRG